MARASRSRVARNTFLGRLASIGLDLWMFAGFTFELGVATRTIWSAPGWTIAALLVAALVSLLVTMGPALLHQVGKINAAIGAILGNPDMQPTEFAVAEFLGSARPSEALVGRGLRAQAAQRFASIRCIVLKKRASSATMLAMPFSINFHGGSFVFLGDTPDQLASRPRAAAMVRFKVLHEIGHASAVSMQGEMVRAVGSTPLLVVMALFAINNGLTLTSLGVELTLLALFLGTYRGAWDRHRSTILRDTEISADVFALQTLPRDDFDIVANAVQRIEFNDTGLSREQNFDRNLYLRENAKNMLSGRQTVLAPLSLNRPPAFIVVLIVACFVLGMAGTPDAKLTTLVMLGAAAAMAIAILILMAGASMQTDAFNKAVQASEVRSGVDIADQRGKRR